MDKQFYIKVSEIWAVKSMSGLPCYYRNLYISKPTKTLINVLTQQKRGEFMKRFHKKASLNLSIQAIVILIFAVIMLGLGLGLIHFIFGSAREKVGGALGAAQLTNPPSADDTLTVETNINVKIGETQQIQIGFYNVEPVPKYNVEPWIDQCKTSAGGVVAITPTISTVATTEVRGSKVAGWNAIVDISGIENPGQYICKISVYGGEDNTYIRAEGDTPLTSDQFFLKVIT